MGEASAAQDSVIEKMVIIRPSELHRIRPEVVHRCSQPDIKLQALKTPLLYFNFTDYWTSCMTLLNTHIVRIDSSRNAKPLSKAQKQFNALSKKIEKLKSQLAEWQNDVSLHQQKNYHEYVKLSDAYNVCQFEMVQLLDSAYDHKIFKRLEKKKLKYLLSSILDILIVERPTDEVKALHDKYSEISYEKKNEVDDTMCSMIEDMFGFKVDDDMDLRSPEDLFAHMESKMREENAQPQQQKQTRGRNHRNPGRKPSAAQVAKARQQEAEQQDIRKSLQAVYRKLAATLHPDREQDGAERERKTELMQRINIAYNKKDLLQLLELQLETEQIDRSHINAISDNHLQHYIKILKEQCRDLEQAIEESLFACGPQFAFSNFRNTSPKKVMAEMDQELEELRDDLEAIQIDLRLFEDFTALKAMLRDYRIPSETDTDDFFALAMDEALFPFDDFDINDDDFHDLPKSKKKKKKKKNKKRKKTKLRTT